MFFILGDANDNEPAYIVDNDSFFVISITSVKNKKKKITTIFFSIIIISLYCILSFGVSFTAKTSYRIHNLFSNYEYVMDYSIDNKAIVISASEKKEGKKVYNLSIFNKTLGLYFSEDRVYDKEFILTPEKKDFEMLSINIDSKKFYFIDFNSSNINSLEVNHHMVEPINGKYGVLCLDEEIFLIKIDNISYEYYSVKF